jgi:hypothetical protein
MSYIADLVAYNPQKQIALITEIKGKVDASRSWATELRRNMMAHSHWPASEFFLLALPNRLYLWKNAGNIPDLIEPSYEVDATPFFQPYFQRSRLTANNINKYGFELIVSAWLNEVLWVGLSGDLPEPQQQFFQDSGLLEALKGGTVAVEVPL